MQPRLFRLSWFLIALIAVSGCSRGKNMVQSDAPELAVIRASDDPEVIERGRYLAHGPAHCVTCHRPDQLETPAGPDEYPPLIGGYTFKLPGGSITTPNLTPDPETGIGRYTDEQLARFIRYGVPPDGRMVIPIMEYQHLSDEDLIAVISYLRSQEPVRNEIPPLDVNWFMKAMMGMMLKPVGPSFTPPAVSPAQAATVERGEYLAHYVAKCGACHTARSGTGKYKGPHFAGGMKMELEGSKEKVVTPNLTPDPETGVITHWSEDDFVKRIRAGRVVEGSHMPWEAFNRMPDEDLRAIYRYLRTLDPVVNKKAVSNRPATASRRTSDA